MGIRAWICFLVFILPLAGWAGTVAANENRHHFGGVSVGFLLSTFNNPDPQKTYGALPGVSGRVMLTSGGRGELILGAEYSTSRGDPGHDMIGFDMKDTARVSRYLVEAGFRKWGPCCMGTRLYYGFSGQMGWVSEENDWLDDSMWQDSVASAAYLGLRVEGGPVWLIPGTGHELGLQGFMSHGLLNATYATDELLVGLVFSYSFFRGSIREGGNR